MWLHIDEFFLQLLAIAELAVFECPGQLLTVFFEINHSLEFIVALIVDIILVFFRVDL